MAKIPNPIVGALVGWASRLRFPVLFVIVALLFLVDLVIPDLLPFADELLLAMLMVLFGTWRDKRRNADADESGEAAEDADNG